MSAEGSRLEDGDYPCGAVVSIKDGKATITLRTNFGLVNGDSIPLARQSGCVITVGPGEERAHQKSQGFLALGEGISII